MKDEKPNWQGFEALVEKLHQTKGRKVKRQARVVGKAGRYRKIDVLVHDGDEPEQPPFVVECKQWKRRVSWEKVDVLANVIRDLGARGGAIFSATEFQSGAISQAKSDNIDLIKLRELTDEEWGLPGRHIRFHYDIVTFSIGNIMLHDLATEQLGEPPDRHTAITLKSAEFPRLRSYAPGYGSKRFGDILLFIARKQVALQYRPRVVPTPVGYTSVRKARIAITYAPPTPVRIYMKGGVLTAKKLTFDLGLRVDQLAISMDRGSFFEFALAGENCISQKVTIFSRENGDDFTTTTEVSPGSIAPNDPPLRNGSLFWFRLPFPVPFDEFEALEPNRIVSSQEPEFVGPIDLDHLVANLADFCRGRQLRKKCRKSPRK